MLKQNLIVLACSVDLLDVDFLSVNAVIGVASHMAPRVTGKRDTPEIILEEECSEPRGMASSSSIFDHSFPSFTETLSQGSPGRHSYWPTSRIEAARP